MLFSPSQLELDALLREDVAALRVAAQSIGDAAPRPKDAPRAVLPGAFNPLHAGHRGLAKVAGETLGLPVEFELSVHNVDKPPLAVGDVQSRLRQFQPEEVLWLTRAATFSQKAALFPGCVFVVGVDTIARVAETNYYADRRSRDAAIGQIAERGCRFLVFGRLSDARFATLDDLPLPEELRTLCDPVSEDRFRLDVSSTQLRGGE